MSIKYSNLLQSVFEQHQFEVMINPEGNSLLKQRLKRKNLYLEHFNDHSNNKKLRLDCSLQNPSKINKSPIKISAVENEETQKTKRKSVYIVRRRNEKESNSVHKSHRKNLRNEPLTNLIEKSTNLMKTKKAISKFGLEDITARFFDKKINALFMSTSSFCNSSFYINSKIRDRSRGSPQSKQGVNSKNLKILSELKPDIRIIHPHPLVSTGAKQRAKVQNRMHLTNYCSFQRSKTEEYSRNDLCGWEKFEGDEVCIDQANFS